jgi:N-acetylglucosamine-6-phosphate deacetylase
MKIIDIHTHGIGGYDTGTISVDDILKITEIQGSYGVSEIMLTIYPSSMKVMRRHMETVRKAMERQEAGLTNPASGSKQFNSRSSKIIGINLEGPFLNPARGGALNKRTFLQPTDDNFRQLIEGFEDTVKIITVAPELEGSLKLIRKMSGMGIIANMGHSDSTYREAEAGHRAGAKGITHIFNAMRGFHHREPGLAGFGLINQNIYIEIIADPFHLHRKTIDMILMTKNPDKIIIISDTIKETKAAGSLGRGITDAHDRLLGGSMVVTQSAKRLIKLGYNQVNVMNMITKNPGKYLSA